MIGDRRYKWTKASFGLFNFKNEKDVLKFAFGYTDYHRLVATASTTAVMTATAGKITAQTITTGLTNPDVPRVLTVTSTGSAGSVGNNNVIVTGTNVEGKVITDTFTFAGNITTVTGTVAFRRVTSVLIPAEPGTGANFSVGTSAILGLNHRLMPNQWGMRVILDPGTAAGNVTPGLNKVDTHFFDSQPTVVTNSALVERNTVQPVTAPNGTNAIRVLYYSWNWSLDNQEGYEQYFTTTSTSTSSTSTSTTLSNTTTSTSTSTSISSTSTSSTSSSTSSTSTSTTTVP